MFTLHPQLETDTFPVAILPLCEVRLMNNALYPWLILVPQKLNLREIFELSQSDRIALMEEINLIAEELKRIFEPDKVNIAMLGNMVSQLHVHIIGRYTEDQAWPNPVWNNPDRYAYSDKIKAMMMERLEPIIQMTKP